MKFSSIFTCMILLATIAAACRPDSTLPTQTIEQPRPGSLSTESLPPTGKPPQVSAVAPDQTADREQPSAIEPLSTPMANSMGLTIDENKIIGSIGLEPLTFQPEHGTQEEVLGRRQSEKETRYIREVDLEAGMPVIYPITGEEAYEARAYLRQEGAATKIWVKLEHSGITLLEVPAGDPGPIDPLQGLWVDSDGNWVLELAFVTNTTQGNEIRSEVTGQIYRNGELLNQKYGFDEMFGYQFLDGKPFYFFKQGGGIYLSYDNQVLPLTYDEIPHYSCCSAAQLNPISAPNWVGFFGRRGDVWYYTEVGSYNQ